MKKNIVSFVLSLLCLVPFQAQADDTLVPTLTTTVQGTHWTLDVALENEQSFIAFQMDLQVPAGITFVEGSLSSTTRLEGFNLMTSTLGDGRIRVIGYSNDNHAISQYTGKLLSLSLQSATPVGTGTFTLKNCLFTNEDTNEITLPNVSVSLSKQGDINGDGEVDIADVMALVNVVLKKASANEVSDVNGDGDVDIADVMAVVNIILKKDK